MILIAEVSRHAQRVAPVIHPDMRHRQFRGFAVDGHVATAPRGVHANTEAAIVRAPGDIGRSMPVAAGLAADGQLRQGIVGCPFGDNVHRAAQAAAAGCGAFQEGVGAPEDLHPLNERRGQVLAWQQAVQAVVGHVVGKHRQAAHDIHLLVVTKATGYAHRRIIQQDLADAGGLLVLDQQFGIAGEAVRGVHHRLGAENADLPALGHLPAGIGLAQAVPGGVRAGLYLDGLQQVGAVAGLLRRLRLDVGKSRGRKHGQ